MIEEPIHKPSAMHAICLDCGYAMHYSPALLACPRCSCQWLEAEYDYPTIGKSLPVLTKQRTFNLWRYRELLPVYKPDANLYLGEGGTPLIRAANLGAMVGFPHIFIKDERQGPTASFKDRQAAVNIAALKEAGIMEVVLASTGNVSIAFSAFAARAGIKLWVFLNSLVPSEKMREIALYGTQVIKVTATYDQVKKVAAEFAAQRGLYLERGTRSIPSVEAMKTIAFEITEQLPELLPGDPGAAPWRAPDWYFQSVSGGLGPFGVQKGFRELHQMGLIEHIPGLACIQADGCSPMVQAWKQGLETAEPVLSPRTRITVLATGDPGRTYTLLCQRAKAGGGAIFESVSDEDAFRAMHLLAKLEGLSVEPASAVAFAGLIKLARAGVIQPNEVIVVNCTGHTMPIEPTILGEGWARDVVLPTAQPAENLIPGAPTLSSAQASSEQEGLLAALSRVTDDRFPCILIVDDTEDARRLIRRILQSQGDYRISEAANGRQGLELACQETPDLIILDLMMPEMDGFAVLDALKDCPTTAPIPVIVVTAKALTADEKKRLSGRIQSLMHKGEFMSDELLEEVQALIKL